MSRKYDNFLIEHRAAVFDCWQWFKKHLPHIAENAELDGFKHDASKEDPVEYKAYDAYFYGEERTPEIERAFEYAWARHIHLNPHHWQHWILHFDDGGMRALDMPYKYIVEMVLDWWSFSWRSGRLTEIFDWYDERKENMLLSDRTRAVLEGLLYSLRKKISEVYVEDTLLRYVDDPKL